MATGIPTGMKRERNPPNFSCAGLIRSKTSPLDASTSQNLSRFLSEKSRDSRRSASIDGLRMDRELFDPLDDVEMTRDQRHHFLLGVAEVGHLTLEKRRIDHDVPGVLREP